MIPKTHQEDLGLGPPEKRKKKKKKVVPEPEGRHAVPDRGSHFLEVCPAGAHVSAPKSVVQGWAPTMPPVKKKKKKKKKEEKTGRKGRLRPETTARARRAEESPGPGTQAPGPSTFLHGDKKRKKASGSPATSPVSRAKTPPEPRHGEEGTRGAKKLKKHKKEKKAHGPRFCEAGGAPPACPVGKRGQELAALGPKRKQGSPRDHNAKAKKKKKTHQARDTPQGHPKPPKSAGSSPRKGSKKKPVKDTPVGDGPKGPAKKRTKARKQAGLPGSEEPPQKKRKRRERGAGGGGGGEASKQESDTDLEVVQEKKGNMDEAHIDQVRRKALQEDIDRESGKTEAAGPRKWTGTQFGQWDTADFENEEQKLKFLKLMGGFKNLSPSLGRPPHTTTRPTMALSRAAAYRLQQSLQRDYDRAASWRGRQGAGLGFAVAPNKVFYIDRNASRSIKFED